jgi:hypothetical protein
MGTLRRERAAMAFGVGTLLLGFGRWCSSQIPGLLGWKSGSFRF